MKFLETDRSAPSSYTESQQESYHLAPKDRTRQDGWQSWWQSDNDKWNTWTSWARKSGARHNRKVISVQYFVQARSGSATKDGNLPRRRSAKHTVPQRYISSVNAFTSARAVPARSVPCLSARPKIYWRTSKL